MFPCNLNGNLMPAQGEAWKIMRSSCVLGLHCRFALFSLHAMCVTSATLFELCIVK